jgi:hypothetical protein
LVPLGGWQGGGSDRRANGLPNLYKRKLAPLDTRFHGTLPGQSGPLVRRLDSFGRVRALVVGPWGECSTDMHSLLKVMWETKVTAQARARGRPASDNELGVVISQIRKFLSTAFIRAHGLCLLNRLCFLGAKEAAGRRDLVRRLEISRKRDLQAHYQAHIRGSGLARSGLYICALGDTDL